MNDDGGGGAGAGGKTSRLSQLIDRFTIRVEKEAEILLG